MNKKKLEHLAIILDGNGRWAKLKNKPRTFGHKAGMNIIEDIVIHAKNREIKYLTVFCFSTENWNRPKKEVEYLMRVPEEIFTDRTLKKYEAEGIQLNWIGRKNLVPQRTREKIEQAANKKIENVKIILTIAFDYGSLEEITSAVKKIVTKSKNNEINIEDINENLIFKNLYTNNLPQIDLLIRTGGEQRLSNFLLLQSAYAELYFTKIYWPDFDEQELDIAIEDFYSRNRKYGEIKDE